MKPITLGRVERMVRQNMTTLANDGICTSCGRTVHSVEPDAHGYTCPFCKQPSVCGAEELLMMLA